MHGSGISRHKHPTPEHADPMHVTVSECISQALSYKGSSAWPWYWLREHWIVAMILGGIACVVGGRAWDWVAKWSKVP